MIWPVGVVLAGLLLSAVPPPPASAQTPTASELVRLTDEEAAWLEEHPVIRVGVDRAYAPIEFRRRDGEHVGLSLDYLREVGEGLGLRFELVSAESWNELVEMGRNGEIDLYSAMDETASRRGFLSFTEAYVSLPVVLFTKGPFRYIGDLDELGDAPVGAIEGYAQWDWLQQDYSNLNLVPVASIEDGVRRLRDGTIEVLIGNLVTTEYYVREMHAHEIRVAGDTEYEISLSFGVRRDWPELVSILDKALANLPESDTRAIYRRWIPLQTSSSTDYRLLFTVIGVSAAVILVVLIWNRSLGAEITKRNAALRQLHATQEQLIQSEKLASMGTLVAGLAHELNNPLNYVTSGIAALKKQLVRCDHDEETEAAIRTLMENVQVGAYRAAEIVGSLREYTRGSTSEVRRIDVNESIRLALRVLHNELRDGIHVDFQAGELPLVSEQAGRLNQVFVNLLKNGIEAVRESRAKGDRRVTVVTCFADGMVEIVVEDNGSGIPDAARTRIFDPFYTTKPAGTGLGLGITRTIVESHGGTIEAVPCRAGARFRVTLPTADPKADETTES